MAVFSQNTLNQVSGFNNQILSAELVYQQKTYWNLAIKNAGVATDLTGCTISAQIVRRVISNLQDTRRGLSFDLSDYTPTPTPISLTISNRVDAAGTFTVSIDDTTWVLAGDPDLEINDVNCAAYSGRIKISFPAGANPADDVVIFLLFLVRSDGVINT
mgnify:CR=1 FL=1